MFTADLKAFSERLVAKSEVKEETEAVVKVEPNGTAEVEMTEQESAVLVKKIKREADDDEKTLTEIKENVIKTTKKRRKA